MTKIGDSLIRGAEEALAIAKGEIEPADIFVPTDKEGFQRNSQDTREKHYNHLRSPDQIADDRIKN